MTVNKAVLKDVYSDNLTEEIEAYLNAVIDEELEKEDINTDLIDECIDALESLGNGDSSPALRIVMSEKAVIKYCKKQARPKNPAGRRAAAAVLILALSSSAILMNTNNAFAYEVKSFFSEIIEALNRAANGSETENREISSIYAVFPPGYSFNVKSRSAIDTERIKIFAVYKDGTENEIPIEKCTVSREENFGGDPSAVLLVIGYDGCAVSVKFTTEECS